MLATALAAALVTLAQPSTQPSTQPAAQPANQPAPPAPPATNLPDFSRASIVERLRFEAGRIVPLVKCPDAQRFVLLTSYLDLPGDRTLYRNPTTKTFLSPADYETLPKDDKVAFQPVTVTETDYYDTRYGSPLAYARPLQILGETIGGDRPLQGRKLLDYGYGGIGHLRLLAMMGVSAVGVDVDPFLQALYAQPTDTGTVPGASLLDEQLPGGSVTLLHGSFPANPELARQVGADYDIIISKNTLKNGYINPEKPIDPRARVDLGVPSDAFVHEVASRLKPGGLFLIYNLCPAQREDRYIPWADGRCPFPKDMLEAQGLEVLAFDAIDDDNARALGSALMWDVGEHPMDLKNDLFARYTLCRRTTPKPAAPAPTPAPAPAAPATKPDAKP